MLRSVNNLSGYTICAKDGELGKVDEFFFDDLTWSVRFLVVETGSWLFERKVLIPHSTLGITDWQSRTFRVNLTMEQVRNSPDIEAEKTVTRQHEITLFSYYAMPFYWDNISTEGAIRMIPIVPAFDEKTRMGKSDFAKRHPDNPHLRSTNNVKGYYIQANDGEIGHVEDFIIDDKKWDLNFFIVDTQNWLPGRKVLISPHWIDRIDWEESRVYINLGQEFIKNSPVFDSSQPISKDYERELLKHYGELKINIGKLMPPDVAGVSSKQ